MQQAVLPRFVAPLWLACRLLRLKRRERVLLPPRVKMVERAVERIIYGGLIQNAKSEKKLNSLLHKYSLFVQNGLSEPLKSIYRKLAAGNCPLTAWVTAKVVLELLDSTSDAFSQDESEFFSLLYGPLLYYHDNDHEATEERFGEAFSNAKLPEIPNMIKLIDECFVVLPRIFTNGKLTDGRRLQLRLLLSMYGNKEQAIKNAYAKFLILEPSTGG